MPPTRDYKRIGEGDTGPNTGGMGTITDASLLTDTELQEIVDKIIRPTLHGCIREGFPFRGILFLGLMMTDDSSRVSKGPDSEVLPHGRTIDIASAPPRTPMLLEYNVRFGDPETQSILVRLETNMVDICESVLAGALDKIQVDWRDGNSATIVLASKHYPETPQTGDIVHGIENIVCSDTSIFHAGTSKNADGQLITAGGRVLGATARANTLGDALRRAYLAVEQISWDGMQYRRDIGT